MPTVRTLRSKGATIEVIAAGEVLFMPGGQVHGWTRRFANRVQKFTEGYAPTNKRPRWGHYGKPLKSTIVSKSPRFRKTPGGARCYAAVGSSAPHAYYVDQGTGVYAGRGPYQGKILPPWQRMSPSLYEHTFQVPTGSYENMHGESVTEWEPVGTITIKGQKGQHFFDKGLRRGFESMLRRSQQITTDPKIARALASWPRGLDDFSGATPADAAFVAQLREWREWRDAAWSSGRILGRGYVRERYRRELKDVRRTIDKAKKAEIRLEARRKKNRERVARWRAERKAKGLDKPKQRRLTKAEKDYLAFQSQIQHEQRQIAAALQKRFGATLRILRITRAQVNGKYVWAINIQVKGVTKNFTQVSGIQQADPRSSKRL